ncbi:MerR family transcriptional regulator [Brachybacterium squillarum]|uniref:MerR family transcriptional regulator n=1 Tax=Brachybacterium squillarum TaxID=661979 RepID=UPI00026298FD|nr:helix-turn-helix domain-containing protein [Brachybacterium squillarum]
MSGHLTIGEFATATWLSTKALRLYDEKGLLTPDATDPHTGYRRYSRAQVETARLITLLRRLDMPLDQVREVVGRDPGERAALIARHREREAEQHARRQSLARYLEGALDAGSLTGQGQSAVAAYEVSLREVPAVALLTATRHTAAKDLPDVIREQAARLVALAEDRGGVAGRLSVIYHGQVGWESDGPVEVCVPIGDPERAHRIEPAHRELFTRVRREDVQFPGILAAFDAVQLRAAHLGLTPAGPPREVYVPVADEEVPRCDVALPLSGPVT